jgi:hypothetical protein
LVSNLVTISEGYQPAAVSTDTTDRMSQSDDKYVGGESPKTPELGYSRFNMTWSRELGVFADRWLLFK